MFNFLPKKENQADFSNTELLATHKPLYEQYSLFIILLVLIGLVGILVFGGIFYRAGRDFVTTKPKNQNNTPTKQTPNISNNFSELVLETGYKLKKNNEWELVTIANEPNRVEIIASSGFNATRIELSSYAKTYPSWEQSIGLVYFDITDEDEKTIEEQPVFVQKGRDGSLYAKSGRWEDNDKVLEIRVFSVSKENTDKVFDAISKSVKSTPQSDTDLTNEPTDESSSSLGSYE